MVQASTSYTLRQRRDSNCFEQEAQEEANPQNHMADFDDDDAGSEGKGRTKSRRELPAGAVATLKAWLLSPEHFTHPYPTPQDQAMLMQQTGIDKKQLKNWFTNARRRIWKPMLKKQIEQGKLSAPGAAGVPGLMIPTMPGAAIAAAGGNLDNPHSIQAIRVHYEQAAQQQQQEQQQQQQQQQQAQASQQQLPPPQTQPVQQMQPTFNPAIYSSTPAPTSSSDPSTGQYNYISQSVDTSSVPQPLISGSTSLGAFPQLTASSSSAQMSKTDSHAVLMELFARDQDLVRQATESARLKAETKQQQPSNQSQAQDSAQSSQAQLQPPQPQMQQGTQQQNNKQHPMRAPSSQNFLHSVPTLNSWPQFSSINSLNNLGTMPGVKSITSLSGVDLANKGNVNKMGNLAQVKSVDSMGKNDSYAFLEVFFGERSSTNLSGMGGLSNQKGVKSTGDEDNEIGLSLEDESPSQTLRKDTPDTAPSNSTAPLQAQIATLTQDAVDSGTLKRAYDDAMAARGLISVSRSSERLTDLVLPAKIQRTLSQEYISKDQQGQSYSSYTSMAPCASNDQESQQYPGQQPAEPDSSSNDQDSNNHVQVPTETMCAFCSQTNVDTQLRPCGHMFHERCLKPSFHSSMGPPKCPIDDMAIHSAVLAIPTDETPSSQQQQSVQALPQLSYTTESMSAGTTKAG